MSNKKSNLQKTFFRHVDKLTIDPIQGQVTGNIPHWVQGVLTRNGPGIQTIGQDTYKHLFDGIAVLHRFEIKDGEVFYQNRALECDAYIKNKEKERIVVNEFGTFGVTDPCKSLYDRFKATFFPLSAEKSDNCNVNVAFYGDQLYAMTERVFVRRVDPKTLQTIGPKTCLRKYITVNHATAHPHILEDGTVLNMGNNYEHKNGLHYCIIQVPPSYESDETSFKDAKIIAEIPCRWKMYPCYYHSFGMTTDKILFIEQPYCLDIKKVLISGIFSFTTQDCFSWHPNQKSRIYVTPRETGKTETLVYETDDLFLFHHINAYEEDGNIIMDVAGYDNGKFINVLEDETKDIFKATSARRYVLPISVKDAKPGEDLVNLKNCNATAKLRESSDGNIVDCTPHKFTGDVFEFPRINYKYNGKKYNFFYGVESRSEESDLSISSFLSPNIISKFNIKTGETAKWLGEKEICASEPIFVPNPTLSNPAEDEGVIISALLHQDNPKLITLLVLDAKNMKELAQVEFSTEGDIPATFHGQWAQTGDKVHIY